VNSNRRCLRVILRRWPHECVQESGAWIPIAIGRFIVPEELQAAHDGGYLHKVPWAVAVVKIGDVRQRTKLTSFADWEDLQKRHAPQCTTVVHQPVEQEKPAGMLF